MSSNVVHKVDNIETLRYPISVFFYYPNLFCFQWMRAVFFFVVCLDL